MGFFQTIMNLFKPKTAAPVAVSSTQPMPQAVHVVVPAPVPSNDFVATEGSVTVASAVKIRRAQPSTKADVVSIVQAGVVVPVTGYSNTGENINGNSKWYRDNSGNWFWSGAVRDAVFHTTSVSHVLTDAEYSEAAAILNVEVATIKAVNAVESSGSGFLPDGRPKILFEGHIFWRELKKINIDPLPLQAGNEDILYPKWDREAVRPLYKLDQYQRLDKAKKIHEDAALKSASWGAFQIMGMNYSLCSYNNVQSFVLAQNSAAKQLNCFSHFLKSTKLETKLQNHDWAGFAAGYNGASYAMNQYDVKLQSAYEHFKG